VEYIYLYNNRGTRKDSLYANLDIPLELNSKETFMARVYPQHDNSWNPHQGPSVSANVEDLHDIKSKDEQLHNAVEPTRDRHLTL